MNPWGTPHRKSPGSEKVFFMWTLNFLFDRQGLNHFFVSSDNPTNSIKYRGLQFLKLCGLKFSVSQLKLYRCKRPDSKLVSILLFK